ncbi:MAG: magnesium protoporphyrin IX methyltransferase [Pseudomonadota bacterium]
MQTSTSYISKRGQLKAYFDRTATDKWAQLTSDAPVSGIRATVRAGRDAMRDTILDALPMDLSGATILDAGCGPGQLSFELARRGADVTAVDLSPRLLNLARERIEKEDLKGSIDFRAGDMFEVAMGPFDFTVAMDSLIHYALPDMVDALATFASRTKTKIVATFAPRTPLLSAMHAVGGVFPRGNRAPAIEPVAETKLRNHVEKRLRDDGWSIAPTKQIISGFYISQTIEILKS